MIFFNTITVDIHFFFFIVMGGAFIGLSAPLCGYLITDYDMVKRWIKEAFTKDGDDGILYYIGFTLLTAIIALINLYLCITF